MLSMPAKEIAVTRYRQIRLVAFMVASIVEMFGEPKRGWPISLLFMAAC
jgi:hypothetical protein